MDLDELKSRWQKMSVDAERIDSSRVAQDIARGKVASTQSRLATYFRRNAAIALAVVAMAPMIRLTLHFPLWIAVVYGVFGLVMGILNLVFARQIAGSPYLSLPVVEAMRKVASMRRKMGRLQAFGICFGIVVVVSMFMQTIDNLDEYFIWGMIAGVALGIPIGVTKALKVRALAKKLSDEIKNLSETEVSEADAYLDDASEIHQPLD